MQSFSSGFQRSACMKRVVLLLILILLNSFSAPAQQPAAPSIPPGEARIESLEEQVRTLAEQVALLRAELQTMRQVQAPAIPATNQALLTAAHVEPAMFAATSANVVPSSPPPASAAAPSAPAPPQAAQTQTFGGASSNAKLLNPDISLIGDFIGTAGHNNVSPGKSLELHESEIGMQAIIDPYARADAFLSFGETGVNVEEAYVTFTSLPAGLLLKVGKMRAEFGKVNTIHNHALPFIDRPLVTNNLVGGEDGIDDAGLSLSRFLPAPKNWFLEGTAQVFRGDSDDVFQATRRQDVSVVGHVRGYRDLSESTNIDLGISYARGHSNLGADLGANFFTNLYAADATLRW